MWGSRVVRAGGTGRLAAGACLVAALVGAGCAREADGDLVAGSESEASTGVLVEAAGRSSAQPYRYELDMSLWAVDTGGSFALGFTVVGVVDGDRQSASMDMSEMFEETGGLPSDLADADLTMETVVDGDTLYIRAPVFAALAEAARADGVSIAELGPMGTLAALGDSWGRVDLDELGEGFSFGDLTGSGQTTDPTVFLDLVAGADDPRELPADEIRGVPVEGVAATMTFEDLAVASGADPGELADQLGHQVPRAAPGEVDDIVDAILGTQLPVEVWVDGDGYVRRVVFDIDMGDVFGALDDTEVRTTMPTIRMTMDLFDYGDGSITVDVPTDSVDVTDDFRDLAETGPLTPGSDFATT